MTLGPYSRSCRTASIRSGIAGGLAGELGPPIVLPHAIQLCGPGMGGAGRSSATAIDNKRARSFSDESGQKPIVMLCSVRSHFRTMSARVPGPGSKLLTSKPYASALRAM